MKLTAVGFEQLAAVRPAAHFALQLHASVATQISIGCTSLLHLPPPPPCRFVSGGEEPLQDEDPLVRPGLPILPWFLLSQADQLEPCRLVTLRTVRMRLYTHRPAPDLGPNCIPTHQREQPCRTAH